MSRVLEERVLSAHPLPPAHRMVLFAVAREVPEGQTEALVNRAALARSLDARPADVGRAFAAGEQLGICRVLRSGRLAFAAGDDLLVPHRPAAPSNGNGQPAVREAPPAEPEPERLTTKQLMAEFARQWQAAYRQQYVFEWARDGRLARGLAQALPPEELRRRVANYLGHPDPYYAECKHSFSVFVRQVNKFVATERAATAPRSRVPDADQTRRYLDQMWGSK